MVKAHPLLREAHMFPAGAGSDVAGWRYRRDVGAWVDDADPDSLMVLQAAKPGGPPEPKPPAPRPKPPKPIPVSKKADSETGEDMKGA